MSCKRYYNQDECRYYPTDCYHCPGSYFYDVLDDEEDDNICDLEEKGEENEIYKK